MKRYLFCGDFRDMPKITADIVIAGCGAAGLFAALNLDASLECIILNKSGINMSSSMYAQGGIAAVVNFAESTDDIYQHISDTLTAGAGLCNEEAARVLAQEAQDNIRRLIDMGVSFDTMDGKLLLTREGGHGQNRILHCGGDATGLHLTKKLYELASRRENIRIINNCFLSDIVVEDDGADGIIALDADGKPCFFEASKIIVATGGIGGIYEKSTNPPCATGDGIAAAARAGAVVSDMEFVQFHPTAFVNPDESGRYFLISEAVRGEGAILKNKYGEAFMKGTHPLAELAPRDIVSRAISCEMKRTDSEYVYLDITDKPKEFLKNRFPTIYAECMKNGIDISKSPIPVMPVQHYFMGGIRTDINGRTNINGLYACGEAACTGVHGANRLASNSLLECLVFGRRCAVHINGDNTSKRKIGEIVADTSDGELDFDDVRKTIRRIVTSACGIVRSERELSRAKLLADDILRRLETVQIKTKEAVEAYNLVQLASAILDSCIKRKESVGAHYRID
ncbi:MAG: L-aspartate oxidase [Clostridia bacterium]|nr:L-aspartate oxidase [Clostridia bacterium]